MARLVDIQPFLIIVDNIFEQYFRIDASNMGMNVDAYVFVSVTMDYFPSKPSVTLFDKG